MEDIGTDDQSIDHDRSASPMARGGVSPPPHPAGPKTVRKGAARMKLRRSIVVGAVAAAAVGALAVAPAVATLTAQSPADQSLRDLGARHGLYIGTAINNDALTDATYTKIASTQFSTVTAENVMKWDTLEPTRGTYNWGPADAFIKFAQQNHQLVRGHVLVWHSQLPKWLTDGVTAGTISKTELQALLKKHITDVVTH